MFFGLVYIVFLLKTFINLCFSGKVMGFIGKAFAIVMFPLSILIICEALGIFSVPLPFDKVLVGAILMVVLQILTLIFMKMHHGSPKIMNYFTAAIFIMVAASALIASFLELPFADKVPLILGVIMFVEALYALH
jgi:hypothetical protein